MIILHGINNCNTVKKTKLWLQEHQIDFIFYDFKRQAVTIEQLTRWCQQLGWQSLINKRGTTWRQLTKQQQELIINQTAAIKLMLENPSLIKRPVIDFAQQHLTVGFEPELWLKILQK